MSDNENSMENLEQHTDEVNNIDNSNKRRHEEEETEVEPKKKKLFVLPKIRMGAITWTGRLSSGKVPKLPWWEGTGEFPRDTYTKEHQYTNQARSFYEGIVREKGLKQAITLNEEQQKVHS